MARFRVPVVIAAIVTVAVVALGGSMLGDKSTSTSAPPASVQQAPVAAPRASSQAGQTTRIASPPLAPRTAVVSAWVGNELVFAGGECTVIAKCGTAVLRDAAAYNPSTGTWRPLPDAPYAIAATEGVAVGDKVYALTSDRLRMVAYDVSDDAWTVHKAPAAASTHGKLVSYLNSVGFVYESRSARAPRDSYLSDDGHWETLAKDAFAAPAGTRRNTVYTPYGAVAVATPAGLLDHYVWTSDPPGFRRIGSVGHRLEVDFWYWTGRDVVGMSATALKDRQLDAGLKWSNFGGTRVTLPGGGLGHIAHPSADPQPVDLLDVTAPGGRWAAVNGYVYDGWLHTWHPVRSPAGGAGGVVAAAAWTPDVLVMLVNTTEGQTLALSYKPVNGSPPEEPPGRITVTLHHCGVHDIVWQGQKWWANVFDATNAPATFSGSGQLFRRLDGGLVYVDDDGAIINFTSGPHPVRGACA